MEKKEIQEILIGTRVSLIKHSLDNAEQMYNYIDKDRDRLSKYLPWPKFIKSKEDEEIFISTCIDNWNNFKAIQYAIYLNDSNEYLGNIGAFNFDLQNDNCEIGYWILGKFEGHGYISEALSILQKNLFNLGFHRLYIRCEPSNNRSKSVPIKANFIFEGIMQGSAKKDDEYIDLEVYSIINL